MPRNRHVPNSEASVIFVALSVVERVPPLIFRLVTRCRSARAAALLSGGTSGSRTKTNNSCRCFAIHALSTRWGTYASPSAASTIAPPRLPRISSRIAATAPVPARATCLSAPTIAPTLTERA